MLRHSVRHVALVSYLTNKGEKNAVELPWSHVNIDLIGPYIVRTLKARHTLRALTLIDPVTGWFEVIAIPDRNAHTVMEALNNTWLTLISTTPIHWV